MTSAKLVIYEILICKNILKKVLSCFFTSSTLNLILEREQKETYKLNLVIFNENMLNFMCN